MFVSGKYLIHGEWREAANRAAIYNPAKFDEFVGEVALVSEAECKEAIDSAAEAFQTWSRTAVEERANRMRKAAEAIKPIVEENVSRYVRENGKVLVEAKKDILRCVDVMTQGAKAVVAWWKPEERSGTQKVQIRRRPKGVVAIITPWNSPVLLTFKRVIPAVLAGNTVVVKPASNCPLTVMTLLKTVAEHFPPGVINIVTGSGAMIGNLLSNDARVRTISFVGGTDTGKMLMQTSANTLTKLYMELGGNDPAVLLPDVRLDQTALTRLRGGVLRAAGQVCSAIKRIYVHQSRADELIEKLNHEFNRVIVGNGLIPDANMGPLNNKKQFSYVSELIKSSKASGAQVIETGRALDPETWEEGYFILPHIVANAKQTDEIVCCEQFGPVIPIITYNDVEEAIAWANDTIFGLRASVWTADEEKAMELADRIEAGAVFHNNHTVFQDLHLDFPGIKQSGVSRETRWGSLELFTDSYGFAN